MILQKEIELSQRDAIEIRLKENLKKHSDVCSKNS